MDSAKILPFMRNSSILEAERYANQLLPLKSDIYRNGSSTYSNFKTLLVSKETSVPKVTPIASGMLPDIQAFWYVVQDNLVFNLHIFRHDLNSVEVLPSFPCRICFVKTFKPTKGIFNTKIHLCLLVATDADLVLYGISSDTQTIINTDFSIKLQSKPTCLVTEAGNIFIGGADGHVYCVSCKSIDFLNYKYMTIYSPTRSVLKSLVSIFFSKREAITNLSVGKKYLVTISKVLEVYNVQYGIYKVNDITPLPSVTYVKIQIVEENPLLFYCVQPSGVRDFYSSEFLFSRSPAVLESSDVERKIASTPSRFLSIRSAYERSTLVLHSFNEDQYKNFSRTKPVENFEVVTIYSQVLDVELSETDMHVCTTSGIIHYSILDSRRLMLNCRPQEMYQIYKNYGDIEFMVKYFQLLTENDDVGKLDGLCKNDSIKNHALFVWIYNLISPVWKLNLGTIRDSEDSEENEAALDGIVKKLRTLRRRLPFGYNAASEFIDEFIQTNFYISLLRDYGVPFNETFESIMTRESDFKTLSLKSLLDVFTTNQSIEPLIKTMQSGCPIYLPLENINLQRGLQLIKNDDRDSLMKSLGYLSEAGFDAGIVHKFNELKFYYGSVFLIREKFDFNYETAVVLFIESVKCKKALDCGLEDTREDFLYPFFDAILHLEAFSPCVCCGTTPNVDLLSIKNPLFSIFLKDRQYKNEKASSLYWKYLLVRNDRVGAVEALLNLSQSTEQSFAKKVESLQAALSISNGTPLNAEVKLRLRLLDIQNELMSRVPSLKTSLLLDSDTLYNDYCQGHDDLKLKILDAINFKDEGVVRRLYEACFRHMGLRECFLLLGELNNKKLEFVFDILINKLTDSSMDFCSGLEAAGFEYDEILAAVKRSLDGNVSPDVKIELLKSLRLFSKFGEYRECERLCEKNFGIRIYK